LVAATICRYYLQIFLEAEAFLFDLARRRLHHQLEVIDLTFQAATDDDLVLPAVAVLREHLADRVVAPLVTTDAFERRRDIEHFVLDAEVFGQLATARSAEARRIALRQHQAVNALLTERLHAQGRAHGAVDATGHGTDETATTDILRQNSAQPRGDRLDDTIVIHFQH
jgi:hypothetical protein